MKTLGQWALDVFVRTAPTVSALAPPGRRSPAKFHHACAPSSRVAACSTTARLRQVLEHPPLLRLRPRAVSRRPRSASLPSRRLRLSPPTAPNPRSSSPLSYTRRARASSSVLLKPCQPSSHPFEPKTVRESHRPYHLRREPHSKRIRLLRTPFFD